MWAGVHTLAVLLIMAGGKLAGGVLGPCMLALTGLNAVCISCSGPHKQQAARSAVEFLTSVRLFLFTLQEWGSSCGV